MDPLRETVQDFLKLSDEELLMHTNSIGTPSSHLAQAILQHRLSKNIEKLDQSTGIYSKAISALTVCLVIIAIEQLFVTIFPPKGILVLVYASANLLLLAIAVWLGTKIIDLK